MKQIHQQCLCCDKRIPRSGFGYAAHMKMHVRNGEASMEWNERYHCNDYRVLVSRWDKQQKPTTA